MYPVNIIYDTIGQRNGPGTLYLSANRDRRIRGVWENGVLRETSDRAFLDSLISSGNENDNNNNSNNNNNGDNIDDDEDGVITPGLGVQNSNIPQEAETSNGGNNNDNDDDDDDFDYYSDFGLAELPSRFPSATGSVESNNNPEQVDSFGSTGGGNSDTNDIGDNNSQSQNQNQSENPNEIQMRRGTYTGDLLNGVPHGTCTVIIISGNS